MKRLLTVGALAATTLVAACAGFSSDSLSLTVAGMDTAFKTACAASGACTAQDLQLEAQLVQAANDAIAAYQDAQASGQPAQALLTHAETIIADLTGLVADIRSGRHRGR